MIISPSKVSGTISIPSSKSYIHRALICSSLSEDISYIYNVDFNDDIERTISCLKELGAIISIDNNTIKVKGIDLDKRLDNVILNAHESGSTLRFLIPLASYLSNKSTFLGTETLINRPMDVYQDLFKDDFIINNKITVTKSIESGHYKVKGDISSQFISGLLFILPILHEDSILEIIEPFESKSYVDLTCDVMNKFGIDVLVEDNKYLIKGNQKFKSTSVRSEGDFSQAAFFGVLGAINNDITLRNLNFSSKQGDKVIFQILRDMGTHVVEKEDSVIVYKGIRNDSVVDLADTPDLGPILFVLGLFSKEKLILENTQRLKDKESNRIEAMVSELSKFGAKIEVFDNQAIIHRLDTFKHVESVSSHNDHRIAMALSILATTLSHSIKIEGSDAINKSYPNFYSDLKGLCR